MAGKDEVKYRFLRFEQVLRIQRRIHFFLYRCTVNCLSHIRSDCLLCLSLCPHSHLVVNTPAGLSLPPSLPSSLLPHTNTHCSHTSFLLSLLANSQRLQHKHANNYFISWIFHFLSHLGLEHSPFVCLLHLCEVLLHLWVPLKPVPLASLSMKPVHFASPHVCVGKCCNRY